MEVALWGRLDFEPKTNEKEGDYTFGNIEIWMECNLVDSLNQYETSFRNTINVKEEDKLIKFDYFDYFEFDDRGDPQQVTRRTMEVFDFQRMKKTIYKMVKTGERDIELSDWKYVPEGKEIKTVTFIYDPDDDVFVEDVYVTLTSEDCDIHDEDSVYKYFIKNYIENERWAFLYKVVAHFYKDHVECRAECLTKDIIWY